MGERGRERGISIRAWMSDCALVVVCVCTSVRGLEQQLQAAEELINANMCVCVSVCLGLCTSACLYEFVCVLKREREYVCVSAKALREYKRML